MPETIMVSGWRAGHHSTGAGYGVRIGRYDRDRLFRRAWRTVILELSDVETIDVNITSTFWTTCPELRSAAIGRRLIRAGLAPWPKQDPPKLPLTHLGDNRFRLLIPERRTA